MVKIFERGGNKEAFRAIALGGEDACPASTTFPGRVASSNTLVQTGAEGKALQGCTLSADSGA
jgi:hypothetical protein